MALRRLASTREGDGVELVGRIVDKYLATSQEHLAAIREAAEAGALEALASAARHLHSGSAHVGALGLAMLCKELVAVCQSGSTDRAGELIERIAAELPSVHEELAAESFGGREV